MQSHVSTGQSCRCGQSARKLLNCLLPHLHRRAVSVTSNVTNASVDYSSFINAPHEYFDDTGFCPPSPGTRCVGKGPCGSGL
jgi:hypothetical protein